MDGAAIWEVACIWNQRMEEGEGYLIRVLHFIDEENPNCSLKKRRGTQGQRGGLCTPGPAFLFVTS